MDIWLIILIIFVLFLVVVVAGVLVAFLEAAFSQWPDEGEDYDDDDTDLETLFRKKNYGD